MTESLSSLLRFQWEGNPRPAVVWPGGSWSGADLLRRAAGAAAWLDEIGAVPGVPVPALLEETPNAIALALGGLLSGRPLAPLGPRLPVVELADAVADLGSTQLVADRAHADRAAEVAQRATAQWHELRDVPERDRLLALDSAPHDVGLVIHTSGTTGRPRPVPMRQIEMLARTAAYTSAIELGAGDRYCSASPFYHVAGAGMALVALSAGASIIPFPAFSVAAWSDLEDLAPTHALLVPTMIDMLLAEGALDIGTRVLQYGASPIHADTLAEAMRAAPSTHLIQIFGQTEVSPITVLSHADHVRAAGGDAYLLESVGRACDQVELRLEDPDADGVGQLVVRAPHAFQRDADGWRRTGDLGTIDAEGFVFLRGRVNDRIVRGGENIYPVEVETVIAQHPGVSAVCVLGIPDRRWGEIVKAVVVARPDSPAPTADEIRDLVRRHLAHFKVPEVVTFVPELPRTPTGKVLRRNLIDEGADP